MKIFVVSIDNIAYSGLFEKFSGLAAGREVKKICLWYTGDFQGAEKNQFKVALKLLKGFVSIVKFKLGYCVLNGWHQILELGVALKCYNVFCFDNSDGGNAKIDI